MLPYVLHLLLWFMCMSLALLSVVGLMAAGLVVLPPPGQTRFGRWWRFGLFIYCLVMSWLLARGIETLHFVLYDRG